jgi:hypothetical protein
MNQSYTAKIAKKAVYEWIDSPDSQGLTLLSYLNTIDEYLCLPTPEKINCVYHAGQIHVALRIASNSKVFGDFMVNVLTDYQAFLVERSKPKPIYITINNREYALYINDLGVVIENATADILTPFNIASITNRMSYDSTESFLSVTSIQLDGDDIFIQFQSNPCVFNYRDGIKYKV